MAPISFKEMEWKAENGTQVNFDHPIDISIPLRSGSKNPNCYAAPQPSFSPIKSEGFIGSVAQGGPCNHQWLEFSPHGNGTHTECYGHISQDDATINQCLKNFHFMAELVTLSPQINRNGDRTINWDQLRENIHHNTQALIIRTLPNDQGKLTANYSGSHPPYLETAAAARIADLGIQHLLVDLPSIDRESDGGKLAAHRAFWKYPEATRTGCTITELVYVPGEVTDGIYLLNLQIISIESDASPSKPVLYPLIVRNFK